MALHNTVVVEMRRGFSREDLNLFLGDQGVVRLLQELPVDKAIKAILEYQSARDDGGQGIRNKPAYMMAILRKHVAELPPKPQNDYPRYSDPSGSTHAEQAPPPHRREWEADAMPTAPREYASHRPPQLTGTLRLRLEQLFGMGLLQRHEADAGIMELLSELPEPTALAALNEYDHSDLNAIRDRGGFLASILQRYKYNQQQQGGGGAASTYGAAYPPPATSSAPFPESYSYPPPSTRAEPPSLLSSLGAGQPPPAATTATYPESSIYQSAHDREGEKLGAYGRPLPPPAAAPQDYYGKYAGDDRQPAPARVMMDERAYDRVAYPVAPRSPPGSVAYSAGAPHAPLYGEPPAVGSGPIPASAFPYPTSARPHATAPDMTPMGDLTDEVRRRLDDMYLSGFLDVHDLDKSSIGSLTSLPEFLALKVIDEFRGTPRKDIRNPSAFFSAIVRKQGRVLRTDDTSSRKRPRESRGDKRDRYTDDTYGDGGGRHSKSVRGSGGGRDRRRFADEEEESGEAADRPIPPLPDSVHFTLQALYAQNLLDERDVDRRLTDVLASLREEDAVAALDEFAACDMSRVRTRSRYLMGLVRRYKDGTARRGERK